jgi:hypothetical protein
MFRDGLGMAAVADACIYCQLRLKFPHSSG